LSLIFPFRETEVQNGLREIQIIERKEKEERERERGRIERERERESKKKRRGPLRLYIQKII
jgi:hypothetical protein